MQQQRGEAAEAKLNCVGPLLPGLRHRIGPWIHRMLRHGQGLAVMPDHHMFQSQNE